MKLSFIHLSDPHIQCGVLTLAHDKPASDFKENRDGKVKRQ